MTIAYENLIGHLELAIRQLEELKTLESCIDKEALFELVDKINVLLLDLVA